MHCPWLAFLAWFNGARFRGTGNMEHLSGITVLIRLDADGLHHLAPFLSFVRDKPPKLAAGPVSGVPPKSASRALILESARPASISLLSLSTISTGVTRWSAGDPDRRRTYAAELVALAPDVILAYGGSGAGALQQHELGRGRSGIIGPPRGVPGRVTAIGLDRRPQRAR